MLNEGEQYRMILGDCLEGMDSAPDGCFDLVLTDPPYCSGATETARRQKRPELTHESVNERPTIECDSMGILGYEWVTRQWLIQARRCTVKGGHLLLFTDWRMMPLASTLVEAAGWRWNTVIVWDKTYAGLGSGFRGQHELIIAASNGQPTWHSYEYGNILKAMRLTSTDHPHQKPVELLIPLIETCSPVNGLVVDPHAGSGSTGVACLRTERRFLGYEIDPAHHATAEKRLAEAANAAPLFDAVPKQAPLFPEAV